MRDRIVRTSGLVCLALLAAGPASPQEQLAVASRSPRNANYTIEATLDPATKSIRGTQVLRWRNLQETPTSELWFHLYWNAWRNSSSSWMIEDHQQKRSSLHGMEREGDWSFLEVDRIELLDGSSVPTRFESPDDDNPLDQTVLVADLPFPVEPGQEVEVRLDWRARIPRTFDRTGYRGDFFFIAHWFPKLGVYEAEGWNCHQFHASTEFYSDFGAYDVTLTLPDPFVIGATGRQTESASNGDGTTTHRFVEEDVHGFAWTASPDFAVHEERFEADGLPPIDLTLLLQPEHRKQAQRHLDAAKAAFEHYGKWYGPYPYGHATIVDPAYGSGAAGMEYPTLFTAGTRLWNPFGSGNPEGVTIHETGHQFWYAMVGNNEFEHAWLDEGLNEFSDRRTTALVYGDLSYVKRYFTPPGAQMQFTLSPGFFPLLFPELKIPRSATTLSSYRRRATREAQSTHSFRYYPGTGGALSYSKTDLWLHTLERYLGWDTLQEILATFFDRWKFRHPRPEDFVAVANEVSGEDLTWFFEQVFGSGDFDYEVSDVSSQSVSPRGLVRGKSGVLEYSDGDDGGPYRSEVTVRRNGAATFPVEVLLVFEDGSELRRDWDGKDRWLKIVEERSAKLEYAVVDPERILMLDLRPSNNSRLRKDKARFPAIKLASRWMVWLQDWMTTFGFFI